jgi:hypothetical protein
LLTSYYNEIKVEWFQFTHLKKYLACRFHYSIENPLMEHNKINEEPGDDLTSGSKPEPTDAQKLIRQHITDPDHKITDDDIRNVRLTPGNEIPVIGAEATARLEDLDEDEISHDNDDDTDEAESTDDTTDNTDNDNKKGRVTTPWDTVSE